MFLTSDGEYEAAFRVIIGDIGSQYFSYLSRLHLIKVEKIEVFDDDKRVCPMEFL